MAKYTSGSTRVPLRQPDLATFQNNGTAILDSRRTRPMWFDGRFMAARDLEREQNYFLQRQADLGQCAGFATIKGLLVDLGSAPGTVIIRAGEGLTPAGEMVSVPVDLTVRMVDLTASAGLDTQLALTAAPPQAAQSRSSLFVIALQPSEFDANPINAYPTTVQGSRGSRYGDIIEATVVTLVPYPNPPTEAIPSLQSALARQIFLTGASASLPDSLLPLAVVSLQNGAIQWLDSHLVRRDLGPQSTGVRFGLADPAAQQAFLAQYDTQLQAAVLARQATGLKADFAAKDVFQALPPVGRFPLDAIDTKAFSQTFFPQQMDVRLSVLPVNQVPALLAEGLALPPIDLTLADAVYANMAVIALIPVPLEGFAALKASLPDTPLNPILPQVLANRSPIQLLRLYKGQAITPPSPTANSAWASAIGSQIYGYYVRRRSDPTMVEFVVPSGITLVSSENPAPLGANVTFTAMVAPGNATGGVEFFDGTTSLGTVNVSGGTASLQVSSLAVGTHPITATYSGDATNAGSTSDAVNQAITKIVATVTLTSSVNPATIGQAVTFTANVAPASATGNIEFRDGSTSLGTAAISGGPVSSPAITSLSVATHSITAVYGGDANTEGATSNVVAEKVTKIPTTITVSSSANVSVFQQPVTFSAAVAPASATGSAQFFDAAKPLGTATLIAGAAALPATSALAVGVHPITAVYGGDANDAGSTSTVLTQTVNKLPTSTELTATPATTTLGQTITFNAVVTPASATGSVQFVDGGTALGTSNVSGSAASLPVSTLTVGAHSIRAIYSGDGNDNGSTSTAVAVTVNKLQTTTTVSTPTNPSVVGEAVTFTATVTPATATGQVQFLDGTALLGVSPLAAGTATAVVSTFTTAGVHNITAAYLSDNNNAGSVSSVWNQTVNLAPSGVTLNSAPNPSTFGQTVTFTAQVTPPSATGSVRIVDTGSNAQVGTAPLNGGTAVIPVSTLAVGAHAMTANYGGDSAHDVSVSSALTQTVNKVATTVKVVSAPNPSNLGQPVTFTITVVPSSATGVASLSVDGGTTLVSVTLNGGTAQSVVTALAAGQHTITANYAGDASNAASASTPITQSVNKLPSTVTVRTSNSQALFGQLVTFTATVTPSSATGSVQFSDGATVLGSNLVSAGVSTMPTTALSVGQHSITAAYSGDNDLNPSNSAPLLQFVLKAPTTTALASSPNPSAVGQAVQFTATVTPKVATGSVQFLDNGTAIGSSPVNGGVATFAPTNLTTLPHLVTAVYSGDEDFNGSTSNAVAQVVNKNAVTVTVASTPNPAQFGEAVTLTATLSNVTATGSVQFLDGTAPIGVGTVANGVASFAVSKLAVGPHTIVAQYSGDANNLGATNNAPLTIVKANIKVTITSSLNPSAVRQAVVLTAHTSPNTATGSIRFEANNQPLGGVIQLTNGAASITVNQVIAGAVGPTLPVGSNSVTAVYSGDGNFNGETSPVFKQTVTDASTPTATTGAPQ